MPPHSGQERALRGDVLPHTYLLGVMQRGEISLAVAQVCTGRGNSKPRHTMDHIVIGKAPAGDRETRGNFPNVGTGTTD